MGVREEELSQSRSNLIPLGEPETVQQLVRREVAQTLALHKADIDLQYRRQRHRELSERIRVLGSELAELKKQRDALNLTPGQLRELKEGGEKIRVE